MSTTERAVAKKGFGTIMVNRLREVDFASTEELAKLAGVTLEQAYSRLMFLQSQEKMVKSSGKGTAKLWSMIDKASPPAPVVTHSSSDVTNNRSHGWKPSLKRYPSVTPNEQITVGSKLLVEYSEGWRHSAFVSVCRAPDASGVSQCWDMRNKMYTYVPVTSEAAAKYNVKVHRVTSEKDFVALENE
jgi:hypothetical protein